MNDFYNDISYSIHTNSITLFVGAGFTKNFISNSPSWEELLIKSLNKLKSSINLDLYSEIFDSKECKLKMDFLIVAQILEHEYEKLDLDFKKEICEIIADETEYPVNEDSFRIFNQFLNLFSNCTLNIITTNYDLLIFDKILKNNSRIFQKDFPINRMFNNRNIIHIHGNIKDSNNIIITQEDYFKFQNEENYIKKKVFTLLTETTTVFIGYGLNDFNLNTIINEIKLKKNKGILKYDMFVVNRKPVSLSLKAFYNKCYGIEVIDGCDINMFFLQTINHFEKTKKIYEDSENILKVIERNYTYTNFYLSDEQSFGIVLLQASHYGISINDYRFHKLMIHIFEQKRNLTQNYNEFFHYEHFTKWLIRLINLLDLNEITVEFKNEIFKNLVFIIKYSSKDFVKGFSRNSWLILVKGFTEFEINNKTVIKNYLKNIKVDFNKRSEIDILLFSLS